MDIHGNQLAVFLSRSANNFFNRPVSAHKMKTSPAQTDERVAKYTLAARPGEVCVGNTAHSVKHQRPSLTSPTNSRLSLRDQNSELLSEQPEIIKKKKHMKNSFQLCEEGRKEHWPTFSLIWVHFDTLTWVRCFNSFSIAGVHILTFTWGSSGEETAVGGRCYSYIDLMIYSAYCGYHFLFLIPKGHKVHFCFQLLGNSVSGFKCQTYCVEDWEPDHTSAV